MLRGARLKVYVMGQVKGICYASVSADNYTRAKAERVRVGLRRGVGLG